MVGTRLPKNFAAEEGRSPHKHDTGYGLVTSVERLQNVTSERSLLTLVAWSSVLGPVATRFIGLDADTTAPTVHNYSMREELARQLH